MNDIPPVQFKELDIGDVCYHMMHGRVTKAKANHATCSNGELEHVPEEDWVTPLTAEPVTPVAPTPSEGLLA